MANHPKIDFKAFNKADIAAAVILVADDLEPSAAAVNLLGKGLGELVRKAAKAEDFSGKYLATLNIPAPGGIGAERLVVVGLGGGEDKEKRRWAQLGGAAAAAVKTGSAAIVVEADAEDVAEMALGVRLNAYRFDRYKSKKKDKSKDKDKDKDKDSGLSRIVFAVADAEAARKAYKQVEPVADGVILARDLVNEPANVLYPEEFARRAGELSKLGVAVEVLDEKDLAKLGMRSLLAVGQGSARESQVVVMRWDGGKEKDAPVAFIGKGVCFDTGGISIKPAQGMEDMKGDMGGAACVTGLMMALAGRKAKVNAIGVIGLVENMPDGKAQRPGDIVTAMSGATIEVINTDAEGRLVLADILWYAQQRFKPRFMVDLATLTGAIMVALGGAYTGMFANDDTLAEQLTAIGEATGEKVWRMPLATEYDKMIESQFADIKNTGGRMGGSCTAAAFLKHFIEDTPWVHLDIAGTAMNSPKDELSQGWASGWGVRLLDGLVRDHYEG